jgi:cell division protein ZapA
LAQVTLRINGYAYTVGCEDGQEAHLQSMAEEIDQRINQIRALGGQSGEARLLLLAALLMADELHDLKAELAQMATPPGQAGGAVAGPDGALLKRLDQLAARAEVIAERLAHA